MPVNPAAKAHQRGRLPVNSDGHGGLPPPLAQSYLQPLRAHIEDRLQFCFTADEAARRQLLVENAVMHGLGPSIDGSSVHVSAHFKGHAQALPVSRA